MVYHADNEVLEMDPDAALAALADLLVDYAEIQHQIAALIQRQGEAIVSGRFMELQALNDALDKVTRQVVAMEPRRVALTRKVVEKYPLPEGPPTLSTLCRAVPSPWRERLEDAREQWNRAARAGQSMAGETRRLAEHALRHTRTLLIEFAGRGTQSKDSPTGSISGSLNTLG
ncbi:MAG TPA: flagellar export chaperone FlgN [Candidatus Hydrogenedentes bacterium]|nr:flagellar export chaperone FlgN [Candidatus Hydrogenedentota bacterium]